MTSIQACNRRLKTCQDPVHIQTSQHVLLQVAFPCHNELYNGPGMTIFCKGGSTSPDLLRGPGKKNHLVERTAWKTTRGWWGGEGGGECYPCLIPLAKDMGYSSVLLFYWSLLSYPRTRLHPSWNADWVHDLWCSAGE